MAGTRRIFLIIFSAFLMPFVLFGFLSTRIFEPKLLSEFEAQTIVAATGIQRRIDNAILTFGGVNTLRDVELVLERARSSATDMVFLAVTNPDGAVLHLSADDPDTAHKSIASNAVLLVSYKSGRLNDLFLDLTGIALPTPMATVSKHNNDLLVTTLPLGGSDQPVGYLQAGVDITTLDALKHDIWIDSGIIVFSVVLLAVELLILISVVYFNRPAWAVDFLTARLQDRDLRFTIQDCGVGAARSLIRHINEVITHAAASSQLTAKFRLPGPEGPRKLHIPAVSHVRLPLFFFMFSEALLRPILPQFLSTFAPQGSDPNLRAGILMASFMAMSLFSVLIGSILSGRTEGPRRMFLFGTICAGCGMFGHLVAGGFTSVLMFRMLTGLGYGLVYAAAQAHIAQHIDPDRRTAGFSVFLAVIVSAETCGPAIGGVLADRFGDAVVFLAATMAIVIATILCVFLLPRFPPDITNPSAVADKNKTYVDDGLFLSLDKMHSQWGIVLYILANTRFLVAVFCFAIPAKALLTGGVFFLIPLTVFASGGSAIESACILMGYGIAILLFAPTLTPLADWLKRYGNWVVLGGMMASSAFVLPHAWNIFSDGALNILLFTTLLFGVGQALSIPTQISFLLKLTEWQVDRFGSGFVLGLFRFLERLGSLAGPLIAGILLLAFPPDLALMWMGIGAIVLAAIGLCWLLAFGKQDEEEAINALLVKT